MWGREHRRGEGDWTESTATPRAMSFRTLASRWLRLSIRPPVAASTRRLVVRVVPDPRRERGCLFVGRIRCLGMEEESAVLNSVK